MFNQIVYTDDTIKNESIVLNKQFKENEPTFITNRISFTEIEDEVDIIQTGQVD
jgi:hypothetical protein